MAEAAYVDTRQFSVTIAHLVPGGTPVLVPDSFDRFEGGQISGTGRQYFPGGQDRPRGSVSPPRVSEFRVARGFRDDRDGPYEDWFKDRYGEMFLVTRQLQYPNKNPIPKGLRNYKGRLVGVDTPTLDSNGEAVTLLQVTFLPEGLPWNP